MGWFQNFKMIFSKPSGGLMLMYHRVIENSIDPWQLSVSPENFEIQLQILKKTGLVISLSNAIDQLNNKRNIKPFITITFDDGYADNFLNAKPLLEKYGLPATFFICTEHIGSEKAFWWDELAEIILNSTKLPETIEFHLPGFEFFYKLNEDNLLTEKILQMHQNWNAYLPATTQRTILFMKLWKAMSVLSYDKQQAILTKLKQSVNFQDNLDKGINNCMSEEQLISLSKVEGFQIGVHTKSHPLMSYLTEDLQRKEIDASKQYLEGLINQRLDFFAYPHGDFNDSTIEILKNQQFIAAVTTQEKSARKDADLYRIGRFQVNNWSKLEFNEKLKMWLKFLKIGN